MMNRKILIIGGVVVLICVIGGIFVWQKAPKQPTQLPRELKEENKKEPSSVKFLDKCSKAENPDLCYEKVAIELNDFSICKKIKDVDIKDECYLHFVTTGLKNSLICEEITGPSYKDFCYFVAATELKKPSLCEKVKDVDHKDMCYLAVSEVTKNCEKIKDLGLKGWCLLFSDNTKEAEKIKEQIAKQSLFSEEELTRFFNCFETKNFFSEQCQLIKKYLQDPSICKKTITSLFYLAQNGEKEKAAQLWQMIFSRIDICYLIVAEALNNPELCKKIPNLGRLLCEKNVGISRAILLKDPSLCEKIKSRTECYLYIAAVLENSSICENEKMIPKELKQICLSNIIEKRFSLSSCIEKVDDEEECKRIILNKILSY